MAFSKRFETELNRMFEKRTHWLRRELGSRGAGKPPQFSRKNVNNGIKGLQQIASDALAKRLAKREFDSYVISRRNYKVKGRGYEGKKKRFEAWFNEKFPKTKGLVYAFWGAGGRCIYIGRTGSHGSRPAGHFEKQWFRPVTRVTIFAVSGQSHIPKLECLAIHRFQPVINKNRPGGKKWAKGCPLCVVHRYIEGELRDIFRFK